MKQSSASLGSRCFVQFISALALLAPVAAPGAAAEEPAARPNIVFILMDDLRWDALGCMGHPVARTPNIDRIAREGALFRNFFVSIPLCSPSRASYLTGQYPHTHKVINNADHAALSHQLVTFPRLLHDTGYETAYVGKWHMGMDDSPRPGFDRWVSFKGQGAYLDPMINVDGHSSKVNGYMTDILNEHAVNFISAKHPKPFLLYLSHKAVHGPFTPAERHKELFTDAAFPIPPSVNDALETKPALTRTIEEDVSAPKKKKQKNTAPPAPNSETNRFNIARNQLRAMAAVDEGVGRILQALETTGQLDNTLVIFTSDNGFFWREHGLSDKRWAYEESIRDPLLMRYPKLIKPGTVLQQFALNIDIAPTLLDLAGAPVPESIQGKSLLPLFRKAKSSWRKSFLTEYFQERSFPRTPTWQAVRTDRWKYIHYPELEGMDELYDLKADPSELRNLIAEKPAQKPLKELKAELAKLLKETEAR